ncbi:putative glucosyltransferase [Carnobacterium sp. 17-4]|uniref:glycosyltransferase family 4 protein n=1 Tax=Carnobacterium sp. (strain 17-4) TaxID=208596 RepID=UPI0002058DEB|nr:glycosyltransferase family 4 protein [Carnobacterium sp. 17-4]AEB30205.1 putative glucosyltransferase [Carnobacterium sp. 17-4]
MINILYLHAGAEMYGADKVLLDLVKNLDRSKYNPYVILPSDGVLVDAFKKNNINVKIVPYPIMRRKIFNPIGIIKYGIEYIKFSKQLLKIAKNKNINVIHTNTAAVMEGVYVSKKMKIPQIWNIHEIIVKPKVVFKLTSFIIAKTSKVVVTDSNAVKLHLESSEFFNGNIKVIYNGVNSTDFNPTNDSKYLYKEFSIPENSQIIGMMGRVNSWKGQNDFVQAANLIMSKYSDVYTILVGSAFEGEEWRVEQLKKDVSESPYHDRIIVEGYRNDSKGIYKLYDMLILPSTNPDPLPTVVLEAMATGKPIIGYKHGGVCEMVEEGYNGLLAEANNPDDLASKIEILLKDHQLRKKMGENSRKRQLEMFSIKSYVENFQELYDCLTVAKEQK